MSMPMISEGLRALILDRSFSSEELDVLMRCITEELEQDSVDTIASWQRESRNARQNACRGL
jgi:hypothetical protein